MTKPVPEFDAEKRRRWYAATLGLVTATSLMVAIVFKIFKNVDDVESLGLNVEIFAIFFGIWLFFFILKYVAGYAVWSSPYHSRRRAILLSLFAVFAVYTALSGAEIFFSLLEPPRPNLTTVFEDYIDTQIETYGLPYIAAALVGWKFARQAPDARDQF